jgi:hypothetical protein
VHLLEQVVRAEMKRFTREIAGKRVSWNRNCATRFPSDLARSPLTLDDADLMQRGGRCGAHPGLLGDEKGEAEEVPVTRKKGGRG